MYPCAPLFCYRFIYSTSNIFIRQFVDSLIYLSIHQFLKHFIMVNIVLLSFLLARHRFHRSLLRTFLRTDIVYLFFQSHHLFFLFYVFTKNDNCSVFSPNLKKNIYSLNSTSQSLADQLFLLKKYAILINYIFIFLHQFFSHFSVTFLFFSNFF